MTVATLGAGAVLYECRITHTRLAPLRHAFSYRTYQWLVDLDELPRPALARCGCWPAFARAITWATRAAPSGPTWTASLAPAASTWAAAGC